MWNLPIIQDLRLKEIDYGPDENMVEDHVIKPFGISSIRKGGNGAERPNRKIGSWRGDFP